MSVVAVAQDDSCPAFVNVALKNVASACGELGRNEACYGNNRVDANFWQAQADSIFKAPSDRVPLVDIQQIATAPLNIDQQLWGVAVLNVQANVPDTLPGQAVTMLLMGDAEIRSEVVPADIKAAVTPVKGVIRSEANLRSMPTTTSNIVGAVASGEEVSIIGLNEKSDWYEIQREAGTSAWVWNRLVEVNAGLDALPITYGSSVQRYGPMQAFYFSANPNSLGCREAPNVLLIQSPKNMTVSLSINGLEVQLGSTIIFTSAVLDDGTHVLVGALVEGTSEVTYMAFTTTLTAPGQTFAVTLNADGNVDENSTLVDLSGNTAVADAIRFGCESVQNNPLLPNQPDSCDFPLDYNITIPVANGGDLSDVAPGDACVVAAINLSNLRGGPGTNYPWNGQLLQGERATPDGYAIGSDGNQWFHLTNDKWVRADLVNQAGACGSLPVLEAPAPPAAPPPSSGLPQYEISHVCAELNAVRPGQTIVFQDGMGRWPTPAEKEAALAGQYAVMTLDGAPLSVYYEGTTLHVGDGAPDGYGERARANWTAVAGTHTIASFWTNGGGTDSCVFTVSP